MFCIYICLCYAICDLFLLGVVLSVSFSYFLPQCVLSGSVGIGILSAFLFDFPSHLPFALSGDWIG